MHNQAADRPAARLHHSARLALLCGACSLLVAVILVLLGTLSSDYILSEQEQEQGQRLAQQVARELGPVIATGDLLRLEVSLRELREQHGLQRLGAFDVEGRPLASSGDGGNPDARQFTAPITLDGNIAGELVLQTPPSPLEPELRRMSLGLLALALLLSFAAAAAGNRLGRSQAARLQTLARELRLGETGAGESPVDEITALEQAVDSLPLDLLRPPQATPASAADYQDAGLLYLRLTSLENHVETLDEARLLSYTDFQRRLVGHAAELYGGELSVVRQFGLLAGFGNDHASGSPAFRAVSCGWLVAQLLDTLNAELPLKIRISMAADLSETGLGSPRDIYPDLYNQHLLDQLSQLTENDDGHLRVTAAVAGDAEVQHRCELADPGDTAWVQGFMEPYCDLLERQQELLLRELRSAP